MSKIGTIAIGMSVSTQKLKSGLSSASSSISSFASKARSTVDTVVTGFAKIGLAISGVQKVAGALALPLKLAAEAETTATSFEVLLGSADAATKVLGDLNAFSAATPFEPTEVNNAAKKLLAFGMSTEDLMPTLKNLGDVASGLGIPFEELSEIYGKAKVQGKLMAEDINQLLGRGIPIMDEFAKQMGVSTSRVKEMVSEGKIGFGDLEKAFQSMAGEGGKFSGMMEKQSTTIAGLWSTVTGLTKMALANIGQGLIDTFDFKGVLNKAIVFANDLPSMIQSAFVTVKAMFDTIRPYAESVFLWWLNQAQQTWEAIKAVWANLVPIFTALWDALKPVVGTLFGVWKSSTEGFYGYFRSAIVGISEFLKNTLVPAIEYLTPIIQAWAGVFKAQLTAMWEITKAVVAQIVEGFQMMWAGIKAALAAIGVNMESTGNFFKSFQDFVVDSLILMEFAWKNWRVIGELALKQTIVSVIAFGAEIVHTLTKRIPAVLIWFADNWKDILHDIGEFTLTVFTNLGSNIVNIIKNIPKLVTGQVSFGELWTPLLEGAEFALKELPDIPERQMGELEKTLRKDVNKLKTSLAVGAGDFLTKRRAELFPPKTIKDAQDSLADLKLDPKELLPEDPMANQAKNVAGAVQKEIDKIKGPESILFGSAEAAKMIADAFNTPAIEPKILAAPQDAGPIAKKPATPQEVIKESAPIVKKLVAPPQDAIAAPVAKPIATPQESIKTPRESITDSAVLQLVEQLIPIGKMMVAAFGSTPMKPELAAPQETLKASAPTISRQQLAAPTEARVVGASKEVSKRLEEMAQEQLAELQQQTRLLQRISESEGLAVI